MPDGLGQHGLIDEGSKGADELDASDFYDKDGNFDIKTLIATLKTIDIDEKDLESMVSNYMFNNMYGESYSNFLEETGYEGPNLKDAISRRHDVRKAILEYRIQDAIDITNDIDAKILEDNVDILFNLLSVTMMEIIKKGDMMEAIRYARETLAPLVKRERKLVDKLEDIMSLFSINDMNSREAADAISKAYLPQEVAKQLDKAVLERYQMDRSILEYLLKESRWLKDKLYTKIGWKEIVYNDVANICFRLRDP
ncbi:hypothetical protein X943_000456 [Babesia divergens]|uniref:CTLH domain-containing protein n=1 Tax=Babesia divergens TaxID=32595 RepID=A0AAD9LI50_BABDI|nr:hypothetical protein X943_000456 [Babesia divergens]